MKKPIALAAVCILIAAPARADYINYFMLHVEMNNTMEEHGRQKAIRNKQAAATGLEAANAESTGKWKDRYRKIKGRLNSLGLLLDAGLATAEAIPTLNRIKRAQNQIWEECRALPVLIPMAAESEIAFADRAQMLIRFLAGLVLTYGDVNQMKPGDRKMLLNHAVDQLNALEANSTMLLASIRSHKHALAMRDGHAGFGNWVNREREIMDEIIKNAKNLAK